MNYKTTAGLGIYGLWLRLGKDYNEKLEGLTTGVRIMLDVCLQLRFAADFYAKVYDCRFSGWAEKNP